MEKVVITGATSMIGIAIIEECLKHDIKKIYAVVRPCSSHLGRLPADKRITVIELDACQYRNLADKIPDSCDVFYHIAWSESGADRNQDVYGQAENILHTLNALRAAEALGCTKFIGAGSQAEYGRLDIEKIAPDSPANPVQPYGIAKYAAGKLAAEEAKRRNIDFLWVRIFSIYGKYDKPSTMVSNALREMGKGRRVSFTAAEQRWDYLYSTDAGRAFYLVGEKSVGNKVYCLGSGKARPLREYICMIRDIVNPGLAVGIGDIPYPEGAVMNLCADISLLQEDTGWEPEYDFEEGIWEYDRCCKE